MLSILIGGIAFRDAAQRSGPVARGGEHRIHAVQQPQRGVQLPPRAIRSRICWCSTTRCAASPPAPGRVPRHSDRRGGLDRGAARREDVQVLGAGHDRPRRAQRPRRPPGEPAAGRGPQDAAPRAHRPASSRAVSARSCARATSSPARGTSRSTSSRTPIRSRSTGRRTRCACRRSRATSETLEARVNKIIKKLDELPRSRRSGRTFARPSSRELTRRWPPHAPPSTTPTS